MEILSDETIKSPTTSDNSLTPALSFYGFKPRVKFTGRCLKQDKITYTLGKTIKIYIAYELSACTSHSTDPTLKNCLLGGVKLTKNANSDKYHYSSYGIEFDRNESFPFPGIGFGKNVIIFGVGMNSSVHVDNKGKEILILGKGSTQGLGEHSVTAEKMYSIKFTETRKKF